MAVAVDRLVSAQEIFVGLDRAIETIVDKIGWFNGKEIMIYLEAYKSKMLMQDIPQETRLTRFARVVTPSIHSELL